MKNFYLTILIIWCVVVFLFSGFVYIESCEAEEYKRDPSYNECVDEPELGTLYITRTPETGEVRYEEYFKCPTHGKIESRATKTIVIEGYLRSVVCTRCAVRSLKDNNLEKR